MTSFPIKYMSSMNILTKAEFLQITYVKTACYILISV